MTQISGKKYQMRNAAGTENRFPYTVIEAVLGLSTYLQDQFSALADIYMPIEGITESKTEQEFVYRKSPATIKAKSLTLDRIYGKTLAWNSLVQNGNFASTDNWTVKRAGFSVSSGVASITFSNAGDSGVVQLLGGAERYNHKILVRYTVTAITGTWKIGVFRGNTSNPLNSAGHAEDISATGYHCAIITLSTALDTSTNTGYYFGFGRALAVGNTLSVKNVTACDLTLLYGSEIDGMTDAEILAKFESEFPCYHDFGNKLISNDAESIETVGFNLFDEEWESGALEIWSSGGPTANADYQRMKNFMPCLPSTQYYFKGGGGVNGWRICMYDADKNYLGSSIGFVEATNNVITTAAGANYIRCYLPNNYVYQNCINLSDPAKNGTYEPYRKTTLQLGLDNFKVKSHNIWDEEWEYGYIDLETGAVTRYDGTSTPSTVNHRIISKNPIPVLPDTTYYIYFGRKGKANDAIYVVEYDADGNFVFGSGAQRQNNVYTTQAQTRFIRFQNYFHDISYSNDICINVSSSFNGQYEPHGDITITGGLKSAGSVKDEIVGNKYIQRIKREDLGSTNYTASEGIFFSEPISGMAIKSYCVCDFYNAGTPGNTAEARYGADDTIRCGHDKRFYIKDTSYNSASDLKTAVTGKYIDVIFATPIEYELVEPLVYSMAAGTTEERISPNSDGLSAPFCCDMTYDANANNDSANAQYAATAGRLYNTHKLWGRDFDGSNDVSGALSGVTTIDASGNITTAAQLISTVATGTAPLSVASTTEVANLHSYTATKLHTQRTLWGQNFDGSGNVTGDMSSVGNIAFSASGKNIASLLYFDTTNSRVGVGASSPAYKLDVNGTLNASGNTTIGGTLDARGNTTIGGTFTVGTSSVNKATTLYGALTASGAVSFSDTLTIAGLTTFNGNAILPANKTFTIGPSSGTHATLEWDATNGCVKITGNLRVTGWIEQQGTQSNS